jgi:lysophospholipase L1-like esterase
MSFSKMFYNGNKVRLLVVGDSLTAHTRVSLSKGNYSLYNTPLTDYEGIIANGLVTIQGISGGNLAEHSEKMIDIMVRHKPQGILLMISGNDLDNALKKYKDVDIAVALVKAQLIAFALDIQKHDQVHFHTIKSKIIFYYLTTTYYTLAYFLLREIATITYAHDPAFF